MPRATPVSLFMFKVYVELGVWVKTDVNDIGYGILQWNVCSGFA